MSKRVPILDHGYLQIIETWGSDETIVESARMSTGKGFLGWGPVCAECGFGPGDHDAGCSELDATKPGDEKLLRFLYEHRHSTPFEFAGATIEVQAPIMVFREWHRHRTQSYSERSARYAPLPDFNYVPNVERLLRNSATNKQAGSLKGSRELDESTARTWQHSLAQLYQIAEEVYQAGLAAGVPKELARLAVPVGRYSVMRASTDLRNWLAFATLRCAPNAQEEIRLYADAALDALRAAFPRTVALFDELRRGP